MSTRTTYAGLALCVFLISASAFAAGPFQATAPTALFSYSDARMLGTIIIAGVLILGLGISAHMVLVLTLMSKRKEDHIGRRDPSDIGARLLKGMRWPPVYEETYLPALEDDSELRNAQRENTQVPGTSAPASTQTIPTDQGSVTSLGVPLQDAEHSDHLAA